MPLNGIAVIHKLFNVSQSLARASADEWAFIESALYPNVA